MKRALLIGNNYTGSNAELLGCHNDVAQMSSFLQTRGYQVRELYEATRREILDCFRDLLASDASQLFFHFSGHGSQSLLRPFRSSGQPSSLVGALARYLRSDEPDLLDECVCGTDADVLDNEFFDMLRSVSSSRQLVALLDCCHSGSAMDLRYTFESLRNCEINGREDLSARVVMFSGCGDSQTSADVQDGPQAHGAMTRAFLDVLGELPDNAPLQGVLKSLRGLLRVRGFTQRPCLSLGHFEDITRTTLSL